MAEIAMEGIEMDDIVGEVAIEIDAPPQTLYDYLLDFTRHPEWARNLSRVTPLTPAPIGVGSRFKTMEGAPPAPLGRTVRAMAHLVRGMLGGAKGYSVAEITALEPGRRLAWTGTLPSRQGEFQHADWEIVLEPHGGGTRRTQRFRYCPQTPDARQMLAALGDAPGICAGVLVSLRQLKQRLEAPAARGALARGVSP
jgi:uncharacterized protein YndB with AHSA1/START domain